MSSKFPQIPGCLRCYGINKMRLARAEQRDRAGAAYKKLRIQRLLHDAMVITTEVTSPMCTQNAEALLPASRQMQSLHLRGAFISARYLVNTCHCASPISLRYTGYFAVSWRVENRLLGRRKIFRANNTGHIPKNAIRCVRSVFL